MTYYVLVEDTLACPVLYGVMQYSDAQRQIPFTADRKRFVLQLADEIRRKRGSATCTGNINTLAAVGSVGRSTSRHAAAIRFNSA
jgi:hypothetical protein